MLAIESGEVHGRCGLSLSSLKSTKPDWLRDNKVNLLVQIALEKSPDLPNVPLLFDLLGKSDDKQLMTMMVGPTAMSRPFAGPPNMQPGKADVLRRAFDATMMDPDFIVEARTLQTDIAPTRGEDVQKLVMQIYATPRAVIERAKALVAVK
jgi:hypothetical protein